MLRFLEKRRIERELREKEKRDEMVRCRLNDKLKNLSRPVQLNGYDVEEDIEPTENELRILLELKNR